MYVYRPTVCCLSVLSYSRVVFVQSVSVLAVYRPSVCCLLSLCFLFAVRSCVVRLVCCLFRVLSVVCMPYFCVLAQCSTSVCYLCAVRLLPSFWCFVLVQSVSVLAVYRLSVCCICVVGRLMYCLCAVAYVCWFSAARPCVICAVSVCCLPSNVLS